MKFNLFLYFAMCFNANLNLIMKAFFFYFQIFIFFQIRNYYY